MRTNQLCHDKASNRKELAVNAIATEMRDIVLSAAEPVRPGETVKGQIRRAWETLGRPSYWRVRAAWYGKAGCWSATAVDDLRHRAAKRRQQEEAGRAAISELAQTYITAAARLRSRDADFHSVEIARLERLAREVGAVGSAMASRD